MTKLNRTITWLGYHYRMLGLRVHVGSLPHFGNIFSLGFPDSFHSRFQTFDKLDGILAICVWSFQMHILCNSLVIVFARNYTSILISHKLFIRNGWKMRKFQTERWSCEIHRLFLLSYDGSYYLKSFSSIVIKNKDYCHP